MDKKMQKWPNQIVIIRHGESLINLERERIEQFEHDRLKIDIQERDMDIELSEEGVRQAVAAGKALKEYPKFDVVYASPYKRCRQTAEAIFKGMEYSPKFFTEERIREKEFGAIDKLTKKGIREIFPAEWERRQMEGKYYYRPPSGESYPDVGLRVHSFLGTLARDRREQNVMIVCHSVVVKMFRKLLERMEEEDVLEVDKVDDVKNASITTYEYNKDTERIELKEYNKTFY